ncbi:MAG: HAD family hydrolase [Thermonemataceae bacterium]
MPIKLPIVPSSIQNIIFDLGGVIINIDFDLTMQALQQFTTQEDLGKGAYLGKAPLFYEYETGQIGSATFLQRLQTQFQLKASTTQLNAAWNALLLDIPAARIALLQQLQSQYRLFLLSNTNPIHFEAVEQILYKASGVAHFHQLFEKVYLSYEMGKAKPEAAIYQQVLKENTLEAAATLFIDDSLANIEAAQQLGIQTVHIEPEQYTILDIFP